MATINQLSAVDSLSLSDLIAIFSTSNSDARKASLSLLVNLLQQNIVSNDDKRTQYYAPAQNGFSVQVNDAGQSVWLILTPVADYAAGTIVLPSVANCTDKQEVLCNCTHAVTALTITGNGSSVVGAPTSLTANDRFRLRFDGVTKTWYRV